MEKLNLAKNRIRINDKGILILFETNLDMNHILEKDQVAPMITFGICKYTKDLYAEPYIKLGHIDFSIWIYNMGHLLDLLDYKGNEESTLEYLVRIFQERFMNDIENEING